MDFKLIDLAHTIHDLLFSATTRKRTLNNIAEYNSYNNLKKLYSDTNRRRKLENLGLYRNDPIWHRSICKNYISKISLYDMSVLLPTVYDYATNIIIDDRKPYGIYCKKYIN